jgi:NAD(P)-dependent dehydrogenase (short-subunit alcohol dehydrogenase family)
MTAKVAVITGGSQGVGAGLVTGYRGRGWAVVASDGRSLVHRGPQTRWIRSCQPRPRRSETCGAAWVRMAEDR